MKMIFNKLKIENEFTQTRLIQKKTGFSVARLLIFAEMSVNVSDGNRLQDR